MPDCDNKLLLPAVILIVLATLVGFTPLPADPDVWFHLADGEYILAHGQVPRTDPYSFTRFGQPWVPHSWLFDAAVAFTWHELGPRATEAVMALVFMIAIVLSFGLLTARRVPPMLALAVCAALAIFAGNTRGVRPQVVSLLLANLVIVCLARHRDRPGLRVLIVLPPLFLLWAQLHAACVMGLAVVAIWLGGRFLEAMRDRAWGARRRELMLLSAALTCSALAVLITPHAITHYEYAGLTMGLGFLRARVSEWQAPQALRLAVPDVYHYLLILAVLVALARSPRRAGWAETGVAAALLLLACSATRHIPLACIGSIPLLANALGRPDTLKFSDCGRTWRPAGVLAVAVVLLLSGMWRFPSEAHARYAQTEPVNGARALCRLRTPPRVFTTYNTGPYLLWAARGQLRVFVDSRADVYGDQLLADADRAAHGRDWEPLFGRWRIDAAVVERRDPLAGILSGHADWILLAEDHDELTFLRTIE